MPYNIEKTRSLVNSGLDDDNVQVSSIVVDYSVG